MKKIFFPLTFFLLIWISFGQEVTKSSVKVSEEDLKILSENKAFLKSKKATFPDSKIIQTDSYVLCIDPKYTPEEVGVELGLVLVSKLVSIPNAYVYKVTSQDMSEESFATVEKLASAFPGVKFFERVSLQPLTTRVSFTDPLYPQQWHLHSYYGNGVLPNSHIFVEPVWNSGITGHGIKLAVIDDALDYQHPDISPQYDPSISYDFINGGSDPKPQDNEQSHGTSCAGVAGAAADNYTCGVGAAIGVSLGGIRLITGNPVSTQLIADALNFQKEVVDIYSNSWGSNACEVVGSTIKCYLNPLSRLIAYAFLEGTLQGRGGMGNIFVFAAGNSRKLDSNVNYQDIPRNIRVIPVAAYGSNGQVAPYSDPGASLHVSAPNNSYANAPQITTSDLSGSLGVNPTDCRSDFGGTSSATPLVAGVIALMLQANSKLTWRDVQDILVRTSRRMGFNKDDWHVNGAGIYFSHDHGFGGIDAEAAVSASLKRTHYLTCQSCSNSNVNNEAIPIPDAPGPSISSMIEVTSAPMNTLEHTIVSVTISHPHRGDLFIEVVSPRGTHSVLALPRNDLNADYVSWNFLTRFNWGESPLGVWVLTIRDQIPNDSGTLISWNLKFYGPCNSSQIVCQESVPDESANAVVQSSSCFIATASYGHQDPNVKILRQFRDKVLMKSTLGREFVGFYYQVSPFIADWIGQYKSAKLVTRIVLFPFIQFAQLLI